MKILYKTMGLGLLSACLYLLCAAPASAKVCFVGDENCGAGGSFEPAEELPNEDLCRQEKYDTLASACANPGGVCPYDARYVRCCPSEYAYQACVFPLETVKTQNSEGKTVADKCGSLFKCKCNSEYKTPADWSSQASSACQPGGGVCIMSTTDTVYYNKCVCDVNYFPYEGSCPDNMTQIESCRDSDGKTRVSCQCPSNYRTCTYGGAPGAKSCKQGGLTLYSSCKSAEDECENAGYFKDCYTQTCYYDTNSTIYDKGRYPTSCEDSYEACPYAYGFYKCRWSAESYCAKWDMTEYSKQLPSTCTKDGVQGTVIPCNLGGSYNGGGSTSNYLGYYRCKLTCEQQARGAISQGYLTVNNNIVDSKGNYGFVRTDSKGKHLYLIGDVGLPKGEMGEGDWGHAQMAKESYVSINGINALYDVDSSRYSSCSDNRTSSYRPTVYLSNKRITKKNYILDVDLSDVNITFVLNSGDGDGSEDYQLRTSHTWKNISLSHSATKSYVQKLGLTDSCEMRKTSKRSGWKDVAFDGNRNRINVLNKSTLTLTGSISLYLGGGCFTSDEGNLKNNEGCSSYTNFYIGGEWGKIIFDNATISGRSSNDFYCAAKSTVLFKSSTGLVGKIWSQCSVGLLDSNIQLSLLHIQPHNNGEANTSFGGGVELNGTCYKKTPGVYLKNSTLTLGGKSYRWPSMIRDDSDYGKMYISKDSKVIVYGSLHLGPGSSVCFPDAGNTKYVTSTKGGYRLENGDNGSAVVAFSGSSGYQRLYFYDKNDNWTCMPYNQGICTDYNKYKRSYVLGHVSATGHYGNWSGVDPNNWKPGWSSKLLFPACYNMQACGLGYNN